jgi:hypothetical protein
MTRKRGQEAPPCTRLLMVDEVAIASSFASARTSRVLFGKTMSLTQERVLCLANNAGWYERCEGPKPNPAFPHPETRDVFFVHDPFTEARSVTTS